MEREIIEIDEEKCNGCGECIPNCPEGALQIIDDKARLVSDLHCDGLGACIGHCPQEAMHIIKREAEPYDEKKVMEEIVKKGENTIKAHLEHLKEHGEEGYLKEATEFLEENGIDNPLEKEDKAPLPHSCPGSAMQDFRKEEKAEEAEKQTRQRSELGQWPVQLMLVSPNASYFNDADLLIAADCVPFANANFHSEFLEGKSLVIGCPKLDDVKFYKEKLTAIFKDNNIKSITIAHMEVPCCFGLQSIVEEALGDSGKEIPVEQKIISVRGEITD
ncbi:MAG: 4Fe-4S ferredoxin [Candidatus Diapherotrites archaeon]|uniref:4Fe-4S ferredoxin n=1 Tax=Candidatus Iainarchaeum sp. TaxID=3101447 RepID=A0A2D6M1T5_9ARCH|nr:4Fe-4S ferredoxin [Candidatus Diapherotrites archaeon]